MNSTRIVLIGIPALIGLFFLIDHLYVSQRERIEALIGRGIEAVEKGDLGSIEEMVSQDYDFDGKNRDEFLRLCEVTLKKYSPMGVMHLQQEITLSDGESALVHCTVITTPKEKSQLPGAVRTSWKIHFKKVMEEWKVSGVKLVL